MEHGLRIIREFAPVIRAAGVRAAMKFQLRNLDTFIHPVHHENKENKHISRFLSTRLSDAEFQTLTDECRKHGFIPMATPFDEDSVELAKQLNVEILKVASCSARDWPLLEKISETGKPVVISTAGLSVDDVDNLVSFFDHRAVQYALMHCVAIYPTPSHLMNLGRISFMRKRYPHVPLGFSTHEDPDDTHVIALAYAKGARLFERHVGVETERVKLNAYSSRPEQIRKWLKAYAEGVAMTGAAGGQEYSQDQSEQASLRSLQRGVFAKKDIKKDEVIKRDDVFFAMPHLAGQLHSGKFKTGLVADQDYPALVPLSAVLVPERLTKKQIIYRVLHKVKGMLREANVAVNHDSSVELSHHKGLENLQEVGAVIITCINREYCKKIIVILPGQIHPQHYHDKKEESFQVLSGELHVEVNDKPKILFPGDILLIPRGVWHSFAAPDGAIFEEVSTMHFMNDSAYSDKEIAAMKPEQRKTQLINWGEHQFDNVDDL